VSFSRRHKDWSDALKRSNPSSRRGSVLASPLCMCRQRTRYGPASPRVPCLWESFRHAPGGCMGQRPAPARCLPWEDESKRHSPGLLTKAKASKRAQPVSSMCSCCEKRSRCPCE
jgi:hypothetical protein